MRLSRLSLLCFLLTAISAMAASVRAGPFEAYLSANNNPAPADHSYGLLHTQVGKQLATEHAVDGYAPLGAVNLLVQSADELVKNAEIKDKTLAHQIIDRLTAATHIVSSDDVKVEGKATAKTNDSYLNFAACKAAHLAERLDVTGDVNATVIHLLRHEFNFDAEAKITQEEELTDSRQKLRFQLHALTYVFYNALKTEKRDAFVDLKHIYGGLTSTLERLQRFVTPLLERYTKKFKLGSSQRTNIATIFADKQQQYFDIAQDGQLKSPPRVFFFTTTKNHSLEELHQAIENAATDVTFTGETKTQPTAFIGSLKTAGFALRKAEDIQNILVTLAVLRQEKAILHSISDYVNEIELSPDPTAQGSAYTNILMTQPGAVLYQQAPHSENKTDNDDGIVVENKTEAPSAASQSSASPTGQENVVVMTETQPPFSSPIMVPQTPATLPDAPDASATSSASSSSLLSKLNPFNLLASPSSGSSAASTDK